MGMETANKDMNMMVIYMWVANEMDSLQVGIK